MKQRCREVLTKAYLFLDGEGLTEDERVEIEAHLVDCEPCFEAYGVEREVITVIIARLRGATRCPEPLKQRISLLLDEA